MTKSCGPFLPADIIFIKPLSKPQLYKYHQQVLQAVLLFLD